MMNSEYLPLVQYSQWTHHSSPGKVSYGVYFVSLKSDLFIVTSLLSLSCVLYCVTLLLYWTMIYTESTIPLFQDVTLHRGKSYNDTYNKYLLYMITYN